MAEKDVTEKILLDFSDVFADIVNVLIFKGERRVDPDDLKNASTLSAFKDDENHLRWQERDIAKFWEKAGVYLALVGIENQTLADELMPARVLSYDGSAYKNQINKIIDREDSLKSLYPVVTLILHYGDRPWKRSTSLYECLGDRLIPEMRPFVNDYKPHICDVAYLSDEDIALFQSDFGKVARFFVDCRKFGQKSVEQNMKLEDLRHVEEVIDLLATFTNIPRDQFYNDGKGGIEMTSALRGMQEQFVQQGRNEKDAEYSKLISILLKDKRYQDLQRITEDPEFREQLFREFKIL